MAEGKTATLTYEGKPLSVLNQLIEQRQKVLGETMKDAVIATAITVLRSLRADTKVAPAKARKTSYKITDTGFAGGWERVGKLFHRVVRVSSAPHAPKVAGIFPVNLAGQKYEKGEVVKVYKIEPVNDSTMVWDKTKHKGCWYVFARGQKIAEDFAERHMTRRVSTYGGLARAALGFAMAALSTKGSFAAEVKSTKSLRAAQQASQVMSSGSNGSFSVMVNDLLRYSARAMKSGAGAVQRAMMKAANSIAGRMNKVATAKLDRPIPTPFPEVKG